VGVIFLLWLPTKQRNPEYRVITSALTLDGISIVVCRIIQGLLNVFGHEKRDVGAVICTEGDAAS
jgi:hypothetical protein